MRRILLLVLSVAACSGSRNSENTAICGLSMLAVGSVVLDRFQVGSTVLNEAPEALKSGVVPTRVVGYGTARALAAQGPDGVALGYEGEGFPARPGFALALVDDSSQVLRGVLVFESDGPADYPQLGTISGASGMLPLYGMRIRWDAVSSERCPLFADITETTP